MTDNTPSAATLSGRDKAALALLRFFSRRSLGLLQILGGALGWVASLFKRTRYYSTVARNFNLAFPNEPSAWQKKMTQACLIHTGKMALEFSKTWGMPPAYSQQQIKAVHNEHLFHQALAGGKGTIGIVPHFGTWEFLNAWVNLHCAPIIMYKPNKSKGADAFVRQARSRLNATLVPTDERGVKALFKGLKQNGFTAILPDHVPHENGGIYAPFFGVSTWTGVVVPKLISRTQCSVVMMHCLRRANGDGFEIFFEQPDPEIFSDNLLTATTAMNRSIETMIRQHPEQYQWTYKRFKNCETIKNPYA